MQYVNQYDAGANCSKDGYQAEKLFKNLAEAKGLGVCPSNTDGNIFSHIDFYLINNKGLSFSVDVKAQKKISRKDNAFNEDSTWIEFQNVNGDKGWMFGEATHIAFERANDFLIVSRNRLLTWVKGKIAIKNGGEITIRARAYNASDAKYKYYTRDGRNDVLTLVNYEDMLNDVEGIKIWKKT